MVNAKKLNALMVAASKSRLQCVRILLDELGRYQKILNNILTQQDDEDRDALKIAVAQYSQRNSKRSKKLAKLILSCYPEVDSKAIFLPAIQLGNLGLVKRIWERQAMIRNNNLI